VHNLMLVVENHGHVGARLDVKSLGAFAAVDANQNFLQARGFRFFLEELDQFFFFVGRLDEVLGLKVRLVPFFVMGEEDGRTAEVDLLVGCDFSLQLFQKIKQGIVLGVAGKEEHDRLQPEMADNRMVAVHGVALGVLPVAVDHQGGKGARYGCSRFRELPSLFVRGWTREGRTAHNCQYQKNYADTSHGTCSSMTPPSDGPGNGSSLKMTPGAGRVNTIVSFRDGEMTMTR